MQASLLCIYLCSSINSIMYAILFASTYQPDLSAMIQCFSLTINQQTILFSLLFGGVNREMHSAGDRELLSSHYYQDDAMQCMAHHHCKVQIAKRLELDVHQHPAGSTVDRWMLRCVSTWPTTIHSNMLCAFHGSRSFLSLIKMQDTPCILFLLLSSTQLFSSLGHS